MQHDFSTPHVFDTIETDRPATRDLFGGITRRWPVIYADPPWQFQNRSELGEDRNANRHYDTMSLDDIAALPVRDIAADDAVLFMWVTDPTLEQSFHILRSFGFTYSTVAFTWAKTWPGTDHSRMDARRSFPIGPGYVTRANQELMLFATRGEPRRRVHLIDGVMKPDMSIRRLQFADRGRHSEKPHLFYDLIERLYEGPYLELFARTRRPGWGSWGNQVGGLEDGTAGRRRKVERPAAPTPLFDGPGGDGTGEDDA